MNAALYSWIAFATMISPSAFAVDVAKVNGKAITLDTFQKKYAEFSRGNPKPMSKPEFLELLIRREVVVQDAYKAGLDRDPEIADRIQTVVFNSMLERKLSREIDAISISDEEAKNWYSRNPEIRLSQIFVAVPLGADKATERAAYEKIQDVLEKQIRGRKMSFAEAAQRFSEDSSASMGGDLDFRFKDRIDPQFYTAALGLSVGQGTTPILRSPAGFHILMLTGKRTWEKTDKPYIKRILFEERREEIVKRFLAAARAKASVQVRADLLK
jgi:peptidyl-prolyl cis-trans isomerase C/peptidyl-prolyl cis-trans isomerase D